MAGISSKAAGSLTNKNKFNGKEEQRQEFSDGSGLDWLDFGARMYDNQIGRWHTSDRLADQYSEVTPYCFVSNNPILYIDPDGNELTLSFASPGAMTSYTNIANAALGGKYQANLVAIPGTSNYRVEITTINAKAKINSEQKAFYKNLNKVVTAKDQVNQSIVENDPVDVDDWQTNKLDIKDIEAFDAAGPGGSSSAGALIHSHIEQLEKAKKGLAAGDLGVVKTVGGVKTATDYIKAHKKAIKAENKVNGNKRIEGAGGTDTFKEKNGTETQQTVLPATGGGVTVTKI